MYLKFEEHYDAFGDESLKYLLSGVLSVKYKRPLEKVQKCYSRKNKQNCGLS